MDCEGDLLLSFIAHDMMALDICFQVKEGECFAAYTIVLEEI